jgi:hypothetical protein
MNRELFSTKTSAFGSLTSVMLILGMLVCFFLALPAMWMTTLGKIFAVVWGGVTGMTAIAHLSTVNRKRREIQKRRRLDKLSRELQAKRRREKSRRFQRS